MRDVRRAAPGAPGVVGLFRTEAEATEMAAALERLGIASAWDRVAGASAVEEAGSMEGAGSVVEPGSLPGVAEEGWYRVVAEGTAIPALREHLPELPMRRWPPWIELVKHTMRRLRELDPNGQATCRVELGAPLGEARVRELEAESGIVLPEAYRTFCAEIGDGGRAHVTWYLTLEEVLSSAPASVWSALPPPEALVPLDIDAEPIQVEGTAGGPWPGLLRISGASYGGMMTYLTRDGRAVLCVPEPDEEGRVTWQSLGDWARRLWLDLARDIEPFARTLALMRAGSTMAGLENGLGGRNTSPEYKVLVIAGLLGTGREVPEGALAAWQARHARAAEAGGGDG